MNWRRMTILGLGWMFCHHALLVAQQFNAPPALHLPEKNAAMPYHLAQTAFDSTGAFDVLHYRLDLTFPYTNNTLSGTMTATCRAKTAGLDEVAFDMADLIADSVLAQDIRVAAVKIAGQISIPLETPVASGDTFTVSIAYHGAPQRGFLAYTMCAYTITEPEDSRYWFPCRDVPWDKATTELHVTVPRGVDVASVGLPKGRDVSTDGLWETFHWRSRDPMATYLICVTMSREYARWSNWYVTPRSDSVEIANYVFKRDSAAAVVDFENLVDAMTFFSNAFGPYPFEKYGQAEVEPASFGGMEHQTMTTFNSSWIRGDRSRESSFVHELAHMWWGDAVTLSDWASIWLNEGFAVYSEALFMEHQYGAPYLHGYMEYSKDIYVSRIPNGDFPIYNPVILFHYGVTYKKGGWILHMLRHVVGNDAFWQILPTYFETYKFGNASISDFQTVCEDIYGDNLNWFFDEWIYQLGYPKVQYMWEIGSRTNGNTEITLTLHQYHSEGPAFQMPVDVRLEGAGQTWDTTVWMTDMDGVFTLNAPFTPEQVTVDPDHWILMDIEQCDGGFRRTDTIPDRLALSQNFPNPFNAATTIYYNIPAYTSDPKIQIYVFDLMGRHIRTLVDHREKPGCYQITWDGRDDAGNLVSTGRYFIRLTSRGGAKTIKCTLVR